MSDTLTATVRMYRFLELGDCFLVTFRAGDSVSRMLIDCGSFRNSVASKSRLKKVTADIQAQLDGAPLDVVIGTHQHNDHVSGFVHCEDDFRAMGVEQVWLSWMDDPQDAHAREIGAKHNNLQLALHSARNKLRAAASSAKSREKLMVLDDMLGFYGAHAAATPPALPADAMRRLKKLGRKKPKYLQPGAVLNMPGLPTGAVRVYVLGPPRDDELLKRVKPRDGESYDHALTSAGLSAARFLDAVNNSVGQASSAEAQYPFSELEKRPTGTGSAKLKALQLAYRRRKDAWRNVDDDWLNQAEGLALYLDSFTNNSSVALAVELVDSGKVLLFAADAQTGNWLSWGSVKWKGSDVGIDDLLARTVLYKVGHHGSHNATLIDALEKMNHPDLIGLIPVHKKDPNIAKENGWKMPARNLLKRLTEKTSHRVLQMDGLHSRNCDPAKEPARSAWKEAGVKPKQTELFMEVQIRDS